MKDDEQDRMLLKCIARHEQPAFRQIYERYRPLLWRYFYHLLDGDTETVEELLQDTFMTIWKTASRYKEKDNVNASAWIYGIAHNQIRHTWRKSRLKNERDIASLENEESQSITSLYDEQLSPEDLVINRLALLYALNQLTVNHREVLLLCFIHGFSISEVAAILQVPPGTIKSRISYARIALLHHLNRSAQEEEV